jgi:hypothetical protein
VDVFLVERDQRAKEFGRVNDTIAMRLKQTTYEQLLKTGASYQHALALNPKADVLRVVVPDARSGDFGVADDSNRRAGPVVSHSPS